MFVRALCDIRRVGTLTVPAGLSSSVRWSRSTVTVALVAFGLSAAPSHAQTLQGRVTDPQTAVVDGADIRVIGASLAAPRVSRSAVNGAFRFEQLPPGRYVLHVETPGFAPFSREIEVTEADVTIDVMLQIPGFTEDVSVRSEAVDSSLTKSSVPLRDQPMNVSVVSSRYLNTFAVNDLIDALARVPRAW